MPPATGPDIDLFVEAITKIEEFETQNVVTRWRHRGFHVWPVVKYVIVKQIIFAMSRNYASSDRLSTYPGFARRQRLETGFLGIFEKQPDNSQSIEALQVELLKDHDYWFFGSGTGFYDLSGKKVSQHHHALRVALMRNNHRSIGLYSGFDPDAMPGQTEYGPNISLDPFIKSVAPTARVPILSQAFLRKHFRSLDSVLDVTGHKEEELFAFADMFVGRLDYAITCFSDIFETARPKAIFTSNFASYYGWALAHVCRRHRIPFVDIQHGFEGRFNGSYYFKRRPRKDWSVFPTAHLCWSQSDAENFSTQHSSRKSAVIGPTWEQFLRFLPQQVNDTNKYFEDYKAPNKPLILFAGQQPEDILLAKDLRRAGLNILFRGHPTRNEESAKFVDESELSALGCKVATETPLPRLLDAVDGVVTGYSAVILEACLKGIPVLATSSYAGLLEQDYEREFDGLLTVKQAHSADEDLAAIIEWVRQIDRSGPRKRKAASKISDALVAVGIPL